MRDLKEAVTALADCDVGRFGLEAPLKPKHVRDAHGVRKKAKHGHIIRRVPDEDEFLWVGVWIQTQYLRPQCVWPFQAC